MGCIVTCGIVVAVCAVCVSVCLYTPTPRGLGEPMKVQGMLIPYHIIDRLARILAAIGFGKYVNIKRGIYNYMASKRAKARTEPLLQITDTTFDGVKVRIYRPSSIRPNSPAFVYIHGGGWTYGNPDFMDLFSSKIAKSTNIPVVSVDYRLAPENPFPAPFEDCVAATLHLIQNHERYGVDPNKVAIGGDSSGGNLAAAVALHLSNDPKLPKLSLQILIYPVLQAFNFKVPSYTNPSNHVLLTPREMAWFWANYLGPTSHPDLPQALLDNQHTSPEIKKSRYADLVNPDLALPKEYLGKVEHFDLDSGDESLWKELENQVLNPYVSPLLAPEVNKLPTTVLITAQHDVLRDEGLMYAERLRKAGVKVKHRDYNMLHGFVVFADRFEISIRSTQDIIDDLNEHFNVTN